MRDEWPRLEPLIDAVLDVAPSERPALLAALSGGDAALQSTLARLVAECERPHPLLDRAAAESFSALLADDDATFPESLAARYASATEIGRGGMAVVYRARDVKHGRDVAVKVVRPVFAAALGGERFLREIAIVAALQHPHIVPLYDSGEADGALYYVMPYEDGRSLRERIARDGALPIDEALTILRDVCDALDHAHRHGVVHRDIKPENVLLSGAHAMVADFGIARSIGVGDGLTAGGAVGTPAYMPPEQISADPTIDHRADIYAVGIVAYEMLAGRRPFASETPQDALVALRPDVPRALASLVARCLEKRPQDRWPSVDEMRRPLAALAALAVPNASPPPRATARRLLVAGLALAVVASGAWLARARQAMWRNPLADARVERLTDFAGSEVDAAISPDGRLVAFLADSAGQFDAFVTQVGSGQFLNLSHGQLPELFNEDVSNIGFTADGAQVWMRTAGIAARPSVSLVPTLGGPLRPFLDGAVMVAWSPDGRRIAYHEGGNDPIFVADADGRHARRIFTASPGQHAHYLAWSPDARYVYFVRGVPPNDMDVWRVPADGGAAAERITHHEALVAYPVLLDARTLVYVATDDDGTGPWLYTMDVEARVARRVSAGVEHTLSVAAAADVPGRPRRLVTTVSNPTVSLWSAPVTNGVVDEASVQRVAHVPTARAQAPRFARDGALYYLASRSGTDGLWRLRDGVATELWGARAGAVAGAVVGAAAVSPDGATVCAPVRQHDRSTLYCTSATGTNGRALAESLDVRGAGSWSPDGRWIAITAQDSSGLRVYKVPVDGGAPVALVPNVSSNPVWSPDGTYILYSGAPRARTVPVLAVTPDGRPHALPPLTVDRLGDSYRFLPDGKQLVVKQGGFRRQDFHLLDLATGRQRPLTHLRHGESLRRFDVSPDGRQILFERVRENSDIVLLELPR